MFPIMNAVPTRYPPVVTWPRSAMNCAVFRPVRDQSGGGGVEYLPIPRQKESFGKEA